MFFKVFITVFEALAEVSGLIRVASLTLAAAHVAEDAQLASPGQVEAAPVGPGIVGERGAGGSVPREDLPIAASPRTGHIVGVVKSSPGLLGYTGCNLYLLDAL